MLPLSKPSALFGRTRELENQIDEFLDNIAEAGLIFQRAIKIYLKKGACDEFEEAITKVDEIETRADMLRRTVQTRLYEQTLIPDLRADVYSLLQDMNWMINVYKANCYRFSVEVPDIPVEFHRDLKALCKTVTTCIDCLVMAVRSFFRNIEGVRDHSHKVMFYEEEADNLSTTLKRSVFASDLPLDRKTQIRYFADRINEMADEAEDIADKLSIYTIKRSI